MRLSRSTVVRGAIGAAGLTALGAVLQDGEPRPSRGYLAGSGGRTPDVPLGGEPGSVVRTASVSLDGVPHGRSVTGGWTRTPPLTAEAFSMAALTWGDGAGGPVRLRTRREGQWSQWRDVRPLTDLPDHDSAEGNGIRGTDLVWVDRSDAVQVETSGTRPEGLRLQLIDPGVLPSDRAAEPDGPEAGSPGAGSAYPTDAARSLRSAPRPLIGYGPLRPRMRSRAQWGADESWRNGSVSYGRTIQQVHIHHTVSSNAYDRADVPAMLRGYYRYHTGTLGWNDIGYNFLVDRFGRTWVGRAGGARRNVIGAHTLGFNETSTGVAVMGNFETARPSFRVLTAVAQLAAWKLNGRWVQPQGSAMVYSHGSDNYRAGQWVRLPVIDGHRDTNDTACPGRNLYERLPFIRARAQALVNAW